jgi:aminoglycoside phosphotransferase (APT) family kinase protein
MKFDTSGIHLQDLVDLLAIGYGIPTVEIAFTPKGEEAFSYVARDVQGQRYFVRAQPAAVNIDLEEVYAALAALHTRCGLRQVLAPLASRAGNFVLRHGPFRVAVFPFIDGASAYESGITDAQLAEVADVIAALHASGETCTLPPLPRPGYTNLFEAPIRHALDRAATIQPTTTYQQQLVELLLAERDNLEFALDRFRRMGEAAERLAIPQVPTHGDPNLANILIDSAGSLHLTDWGEIAYAPRELDLNFFSDTGLLEPFLRRYLATVGSIRLHLELFVFYAFRWGLQEIADYTTRILLAGSTLEEQHHAWTEIQDYLPLSEDGLREHRTHVVADLHRLAAEGLLDLFTGPEW